MARPSGRRGVSRDFPTDPHARGTAQQFGGPGTRAPLQGGAVPGHGKAPGHGPGGRGPGGRGPQHPGGRGPGVPHRRIIDYPRAGRTGFTRWIPSWKLVGTLFLLAVGFVVAAFLVAYATTPIPDGKVSATFQTSTVYFRDGSVLGRFQQENRTLVDIEQVPDYLQDAVMTAEDRTFESNSGVSVSGMVRALLNNAQGGDLQGGSTITQQYVKNYYLNADRTYTRKVREVFIALKLGRTVEKPEIMEGYLNTIYWGRGAYGIEAAARVWFGKSLDPAVVEDNPKKRLTRSEAAFLAGIINGPELYDPTDGKAETEAARARWQFVVDGMLAEGYLTADEAAGLKFPKVLKNVPSNTPKGYKGYLLQMVRKEAAAQGFTAEELDTRGLAIYTTFDPDLMAQAEKAVENTLPPRKQWPKGTEVALSSVDVKTGEVRAIYGGQDYLERQRNAATQDIAQAGSTFKPFTLLAALQGARDDASACRPNITDGAISLDSRYNGASPQTFGEQDEFKVRNFGGASYGLIDLRRATANSVNTVYVALNEEVGPEQTQAAAICAGIPKGTLDLKDNLSNVLGSASPHPIDMAFAYATIANEGKRTKLHGIKKIELAQDKKVLYEYEANPTQVFHKDVAANAVDAMQQVVLRGSGTYANQLGRPVAGKTGTSSDNYSAWFVGFTPQISTSVAMYRVGEDGSRLQLEGFGGFGEITGGSLPVRIWTDYMDAAVDGTKVEDFPQAEDIGEVVNPAPVVTEKPSAEPTKTRTEEPTESPSPTETVTESPTDEPTDEPTATEEPTPEDPTPTESDRRRPRPTVTASP